MKSFVTPAVLMSHVLESKKSTHTQTYGHHELRHTLARAVHSHAREPKFRWLLSLSVLPQVHSRCEGACSRLPSVGSSKLGNDRRHRGPAREFWRGQRFVWKRHSSRMTTLWASRLRLPRCWPLGCLVHEVAANSSNETFRRVQPGLEAAQPSPVTRVLARRRINSQLGRLDLLFCSVAMYRERSRARVSRYFSHLRSVSKCAELPLLATWNGLPSEPLQNRCAAEFRRRRQNVMFAATLFWSGLQPRHPDSLPLLSVRRPLP